MFARATFVWLLLVAMVAVSVGCAPPAGAKKKGLSTTTGSVKK